MPKHSTPSLGVLGGMGPLASAEFVANVYRVQGTRPEQEMPRLVLYSDPQVPDRTASIAEDTDGPLLGKVTAGLEALRAAGAQRIFMACVTAHYLLPKLPPELARLVIPLPDLVVEECRGLEGPILLLGTSGTRQASLFEGTAGWAEIEPRVVRPSEPEQEALHGEIYRVKKNGPVDGLGRLVLELAEHAEAKAVIFGCTELHLLHRGFFDRRDEEPSFRIVDPLLDLARNLDRFLTLEPLTG